MTEQIGRVICNSQHKMLRMITVLTGLNFVILIFLAVCISWGISQNYHDKLNSADVTTVSTTNYTTATIKSNTFHVIARDEWNAQSAKNNLTELASPVNRVIIFHTVSDMCLSQMSCVNQIKNIQNHHMQNWDDIGPNFLIGGDGTAYEGRGWNYQGVHTKYHNAGTIGIALIGTFTKKSPSQSQFDALKLLLDEGVRLNKLTGDYKMYPQRAFHATASPGDQVVNVIKNWPHYENAISIVT